MTTDELQIAELAKRAKTNLQEWFKKRFPQATRKNLRLVVFLNHQRRSRKNLKKEIVELFGPQIQTLAEENENHSKSGVPKILQTDESNEMRK